MQQYKWHDGAFLLQSQEPTRRISHLETLLGAEGAWLLWQA